VLDLRFNPGGLLSSAIEICDMFINEGRIVSTEGRNTPQARVGRNEHGRKIHRLSDGDFGQSLQCQCQ